MEEVQKELNRKLNETFDSLRLIGTEIKSEILKCNQHEFSEFCVAQFVSLVS